MPYTGEHVLIVDDDSDARLYAAERWIKKVFPGASILTAGDGHEGVITFLEKFPFLVVSDIDMPVMHGIEMAKRIIQIREDALIVLMTGHAEREQRDLGVEVSGFIKKSASDQEIMETLRRAIEARKKPVFN